MARRGDNFQDNSYVPELGDIVHLNWAPAIGHEMLGPHYGQVLSATLFNTATGTVAVVPITTARNQLSGFEIPVQAGRFRGVALLSGLCCLDYASRDIQFEGNAGASVIAEANRRLHMIFP